MADIFISYARADRDKVENLASALEAKGLSVWWDRELLGGAEFSAVIERELEAATTVVVAWSQASIGSHWVRDEADFARGQNKMLPLSLDGSLPPLGFRQIHAIGFREWDDEPSHAAFGELLNALGRSARGASPTSVPVAAESAKASIAVLPFANMSSDPEQEYFSDGMAEEILNALVKVPDLLVAGRTSSFAFKGKSVDIREIGKVLNVGHVLEGSVRKQDERVRITAQLIRASDGFHLWSDRYDGTLDDVFELQDEISQAIVGELKALLGQEADQRLVEKLTESKEAYDLFLRARSLVNKFWGDETISRAIELLEEAVALDPDFLSAWELLARANFYLPQFITVEDETAYRTAAANAAKRALQIDPESLIGQQILVSSKWDGTGFVRHFENANPLVRSTDEFEFVLGYQEMVLGRSHAALPHFLKALEVDPLSGRTALNTGLCYLNMSEFGLAESMFQRAMEAGFGGAVFALGILMVERGETDAAYEMLMRAYDTIGEKYGSQMRSKEQWEVVFRARYLHEPDAQDALETFVAKASNARAEPFNYVMLSPLVCERSAETFFRLYLKHRSPSNPIVLASEVWHPFARARGFRQHPGFKNFAEEIGLVAAWQKYGWPDLARPDPGTDGSNGAWTID